MSEGRREATPEPMVANALTTNRMVSFFGACVVENQSAALTIRLRAGSVSGTILKTIKLASGQAYDGGPWDNAAIQTPGGIYCQVVTGTLPSGGDAIVYGEFG